METLSNEICYDSFSSTPYPGSVFLITVHAEEDEDLLSHMKEPLEEATANTR
jgi:hypothetical protein